MDFACYLTPGDSGLFYLRAPREGGGGRVGATGRLWKMVGAKLLDALANGVLSYPLSYGCCGRDGDSVLGGMPGAATELLGEELFGSWQ